MLYLIISGTCNLIWKNTKNAFLELENQADPNKLKRDEERLKRQNPFKNRLSVQDKYRLSQERGSGEDKYGTIQENGYISSTLKTINIGQKSTLEWIGEEILVMKDPKVENHSYSVVAQTKMEAYCIKFKDVKIIPYEYK